MKCKEKNSTSAGKGTIGIYIKEKKRFLGSMDKITITLKCDSQLLQQRHKNFLNKQNNFISSDHQFIDLSRRN